MRLTTIPIKAITQEAEYADDVVVYRQKSHAIRFEPRACGFTMLELIAVMIIVGIMAALAIPRFASNAAFQTRGFSDQVISTLRYAQSIAVAQDVCVNVAFTSTSLTLNTYSYSSSNGCGVTPTPLNLPSGATNVLNAPSNITISTLPTPASFYFDPVGRPVGFSTQQTITVTGDSAYKFFIEAETGYAHST
jgi:MSHA pilin protein MshC